MKLKVDGRIYDLASLEDDLSLRDVLVIETETAALGRRWSIPEVVAAARRINDLPTAERDTDPDAMWVFALAVWASRRNAGEDVTFGQVVDTRMRDIEWIRDPEDHKKPDPHRPRPGKGSGRGKPASKATRAAQSRTRQASAKRSTPASS